MLDGEECLDRLVQWRDVGGILSCPSRLDSRRRVGSGFAGNSQSYRFGSCIRIWLSNPEMPLYRIKKLKFLASLAEMH